MANFIEFKNRVNYFCREVNSIDTNNLQQADPYPHIFALMNQLVKEIGKLDQRPFTAGFIPREDKYSLLIKLNQIRNRSLEIAKRETPPFGFEIAYTRVKKHVERLAIISDAMKTVSELNPESIAACTQENAEETSTSNLELVNQYLLDSTEDSAFDVVEDVVSNLEEFERDLDEMQSFHLQSTSTVLKRLIVVDPSFRFSEDIEPLFRVFTEISESLISTGMEIQSVRNALYFNEKLNTDKIDRRFHCEAALDALEKVNQIETLYSFLKKALDDDQIAPAIILFNYQRFLGMASNCIEDHGSLLRRLQLLLEKTNAPVSKTEYPVTNLKMSLKQNRLAERRKKILYSLENQQDFSWPSLIEIVKFISSFPAHPKITHWCGDEKAQTPLTFGLEFWLFKNLKLFHLNEMASIRTCFENLENQVSKMRQLFCSKSKNSQSLFPLLGSIDECLHGVATLKE